MFSNRVWRGTTTSPFGTLAVPASSITAGNLSSTVKTWEGRTLVGVGATVDGMRFTNMESDSFPYWDEWHASNVPANSSNFTMMKNGTTAFAMSSVVSPVNLTLIGASVSVDSRQATSPEGTHDSAELAGWTNANLATNWIQLNLRSSPDKVSASTILTTLTPQIDRNMVDELDGRMSLCEYYPQETPVTITAGSEIWCSAVTGANFNGTGVEISVILVCKGKNYT